MNPFDYAKAFTDAWTAQVQAVMKTQEQAGKAVADGMQAMASGAFPATPNVPADLSASVAELSRAGQSVTELWSAATAMSSTLATLVPSAPGRDTPVEAAFQKMVDPQGWMSGMGEMDNVLGRMAEGPRLADLWEVERRHARVLTAWMNVRRRGLEHNAVLLEAWLKAGRRFSEQMAGLTKSAGQRPDAKAALALWTDTANQQLLETQRSEPFLQTQAAMIRASTELQTAQQELVEYFGKQYGFPTRTELDDVHRTVTELRREMRVMRRDQRVVAAQPPVTPPSQSSEPRRAPRAQQPTAKKRGAR